MFVHARSRRWEKLKKNNVAYESSKYVQRAKEYNTVREDTPSIKHIEVLRQMKSWEGEEAVLKHYLEVKSVRYTTCISPLAGTRTLSLGYKLTVTVCMLGTGIHGMCALTACMHANNLFATTSTTSLCAYVINARTFSSCIV